MNFVEAAFLGFLVSGILVLVLSLMLMRTHWRPDIPPYGKATRLLDITLHPEDYTEDAPLRAIRVLSFVGALLLASAVALLVRELVRTLTS
jgi:hypothetical protein